MNNNHQEVEFGTIEEVDLHMCYESDPCQHTVSVKWPDGTVTDRLMNGYSLYLYYHSKAQKIPEHFQSYSGILTKKKFFKPPFRKSKPKPIPAGIAAAAFPAQNV